MDIITRTITIGIIIIVVHAVIFLIKTREIDSYYDRARQEHIIIRPSKIFTVVGIGGILFVIALYCLITFQPIPVEGEPTIFYVITGLYTLMVISLIIYGTVCKIELFKNKDYFIYRPWYGRKYTIKYSDCDFFKLNRKSSSNKLILIVANKRFSIEEMGDFELFIKELRNHKVKQIYSLDI